MSDLHLSHDFPLFSQPEHTNLVYFDSAATSQKPQVVIDAITNYYQHSVANVHRGVHHLADLSTNVWEEGHERIAAFFGATTDELVITRNATESLNGVAYGFGDQQVRADEVIIATALEHHANLVPWQQLAKRTGATLKVVGVLENGELNQSQLIGWLENEPVRLVALTHVSNVLGTVVPIHEIVMRIEKLNAGRERKIRLVVDGAQAVPHLPVNFTELGADFYAFSGHKMYGPMGIGGLLVKRALIDSGEFQPWLFGGGMIEWVRPNETGFITTPVDRFTAGTPDVASVAGLAAACDYLDKVGMSEVADHEQMLVKAAWDLLSQRPEITVIGPNPHTQGRVGSVAFVHKTVHAHDVAQVFNSCGLAVRSGHHCAMPLHTACHWQASTRVSFGIYNEVTQLTRLTEALDKVQQVLG